MGAGIATLSTGTSPYPDSTAHGAEADAMGTFESPDNDDGDAEDGGGGGGGGADTVCGNDDARRGTTLMLRNTAWLAFVFALALAKAASAHLLAFNAAIAAPLRPAQSTSCQEMGSVDFTCVLVARAAAADAEGKASGADGAEIGADKLTIGAALAHADKCDTADATQSAATAPL
jgi:hypothetical protein